MASIIGPLLFQAASSALPGGKSNVPTSLVLTGLTAATSVAASLLSQAANSYFSAGERQPPRFQGGPLGTGNRALEFLNGGRNIGRASVIRDEDIRNDEVPDILDDNGATPEPIIRSVDYVAQRLLTRSEQASIRRTPRSVGSDAASDGLNLYANPNTQDPFIQNRMTQQAQAALTNALQDPNASDNSVDPVVGVAPLARLGQRALTTLKNQARQNPKLAFLLALPPLLAVVMPKGKKCLRNVNIVIPASQEKKTYELEMIKKDCRHNFKLQVQGGQPLSFIMSDDADYGWSSMSKSSSSRSFGFQSVGLFSILTYNVEKVQNVYNVIINDPFPNPKIRNGSEAYTIPLGGDESKGVDIIRFIHRTVKNVQEASKFTADSLSAHNEKLGLTDEWDKMDSKLITIREANAKVAKMNKVEQTIPLEPLKDEEDDKESIRIVRTLQ